MKHKKDDMHCVMLRIIMTFYWHTFTFTTEVNEIAPISSSLHVNSNVLQCLSFHFTSFLRYCTLYALFAYPIQWPKS